MALPGAAPQAAAVAGNSDHDSVVGRLAVGYLGRTSVSIADPAGLDRMGQAARARTREGFDLERNFERLFALFRERPAAVETRARGAA